MIYFWIQMKPLEAAIHHEVAPVLDRSIEYLAHWAKLFLDAFLGNTERIP